MRPSASPSENRPASRAFACGRVGMCSCVHERTRMHSGVGGIVLACTREGVQALLCYGFWVKRWLCAVHIRGLFGHGTGTL